MNVKKIRSLKKGMVIQLLPLDYLIKIGRLKQNGSILEPTKKYQWAPIIPRQMQLYLRFKYPIIFICIEEDLFVTIKIDNINWYVHPSWIKP